MKKVTIQELRDELNEDIRDAENSIKEAEVNIEKEKAWIEKLKGYIASDKKKLEEYEEEYRLEHPEPSTEEAMDDDSDNI